MMNGLYLKRNGRSVNFLYPKGGNSNILRTVKGVKEKSFTSGNGRGIVVKEANGNIRSFLESKCVVSL
jgi:hypothetical protein